MVSDGTSGVGFEGGANVFSENCQASGSGLSGNHSFNLAGNSIRMSRCSTVNFDRGIFVSTVSGVTGLVISECTVKQSTVSGILLRKDESAGLGGHQIVGCTVDGVSGGAGVIADNDTIIRDCIIRNTSSDGVRLSNNCKALNNTFIKNGASSADGGIYFSTNTNILISGNTFQNITGWASSEKLTTAASW